TPEAMPCSLVRISRTRQWVLTSTPARIACGQYVMSVEALAPCAQAGVQWPRLMQRALPSESLCAPVVSDGHQCQPSLFMALPIRGPESPSGCGGIGGWVSGESG